VDIFWPEPAAGCSVTRRLPAVSGQALRLWCGTALCRL